MKWKWNGREYCGSSVTVSSPPHVFYFISLLIVTIDWVFSLPGSPLRWAQQGKRLIGFASEKLLITTGAENLAEGSNQGDQPGLTITETELRDDEREWQHSGKTPLGNEADPYRWRLCSDKHWKAKNVTARYCDWGYG